ncbi:UNVERIFIED_CONTAM: hypothetical protein HHA_449120 [Hammondia hammondi]|eukprot:XP_008881688.1 hypothetical protein HHA_449120 [Hammondia hammondi]
MAEMLAAALENRVIGAGDRVEGARIMLGTSRATCRLEQYKELVIDSLEGLLLWKSNRVLETCEPESGFPSDRHASTDSSASISKEARANEDNYGGEQANERRRDAKRVGPTT